MNNLTGSKASKSLNAPRIEGPSDSHYQYHLIQKPKNNEYGHPGDILADAKYRVFTNSCADEQEMDGNQVMYYLRDFIGSLFIPRVMMRCTIIPV